MAGADCDPKAHRPMPEQTADEIHDMPPSGQCSDGGGRVRKDRIDPQFQVRIPREPLMRRFDVRICEAFAVQSQ